MIRIRYTLECVFAEVYARVYFVAIGNKITIVYSDVNVNDIESENENDNSIWSETYHKFCYVSENFYVPCAGLVYLRKNLIPTVKTQ